MKTIDAGLLAALGGNYTTICRLWEITRRDGVVFRLTDHDRPVISGGHTWERNTTFEASAVETRMNSAGSDVDVNVLMRPGSIEYLHMQRGMFDEAQTKLHVMSWANPELPALTIFSGRVTKIDLPNRHVAQLRLTGNIGIIEKGLAGQRYSYRCRAAFGDNRCKYPIETVTTDFTVTQLYPDDPKAFTAAALLGRPVNEWLLGAVEWVTGANASTRQEVANSDATGRVGLFVRPSLPIALGDTGRINKGCPKTTIACKGYNNFPNFRGEPAVPGDDPNNSI
jgi:uncharacterized phage protein (TIGR02218 family)